LTHVKNWWAENKRFIGAIQSERIHLSVIRDRTKRLSPSREAILTFSGLDNPQLCMENCRMITECCLGIYVKAKVLQSDPSPNFALWLKEAMPFLDNGTSASEFNRDKFALVCQQYFRGDAADPEDDGGRLRLGSESPVKPGRSTREGAGIFQKAVL